MFAVASKLIEAMPVVQVSYHEKSSWLEWLDGHLLLDDNPVHGSSIITTLFFNLSELIKNTNSFSPWDKLYPFPSNL